MDDGVVVVAGEKVFTAGFCHPFEEEGEGEDVAGGVKDWLLATLTCNLASRMSVDVSLLTWRREGHFPEERRASLLCLWW